ncbi:MAG: hypothetical protein IPP17_28565, partial [Bacteroidetes bacterium]|nr:hypothetical protein [Bacteroidota bacterium]
TENTATSISGTAKISFYPNPTPDYALISYEGFKLGKVVIYGMDGRIVGESINTACARPDGSCLLESTFCGFGHEKMRLWQAARL